MGTKKPNPNLLPDRIELLRQDYWWWKRFFNPALKAFIRKDEKKLKEIMKDYNDFTTDPHKKS